MPQEDIIAMRYARGLAEQAATANRLDEVRRDFALLAELLDRDGPNPAAAEFGDYLASDAVPEDEKRRAAAAIAQKCGIGDIVADFMGVLVRRRRVNLVPKMYPAFSEAADSISGERTAVVRTAMPLSDDQSSRLSAALSAAMGAKVWLRQVVEPGLLAGARIAVGDRSFDGTVRGKLDRLGRALAQSFADETPADGEETSDGDAPAALTQGNI